MPIQQETTWIHLLAVIGAIAVMLYGMNIVYKRMKAKDQGFGPNSLKAIGVTLFIPAILILAITTNFQSETLAALLGTVAGYVLSTSKPEE
ncbi:hypothetical protein [Pseudomonas putida]